MAEQFQDHRHEELLHLGFGDGRKRAWLFEQNVIQSEIQTDEGFDVTVFWTTRQADRFRRL